jgi:hypothetical protein
VLKMLTVRRLRRSRAEDRTQEAIRDGLADDTDGIRAAK